MRRSIQKSRKKSQKRSNKTKRQRGGGGSGNGSPPEVHSLNALKKYIESGNTNIVTLDLRGGNMDDTTFHKLCADLVNLKSLENLFLDRNFIDDAGASALAEVLPSMGALKMLSLKHNEISNDGAEALSEALSCTNIIELD
jgi:Ran GTPase-activating protein (RanGAP) involved in mRNA processing and transport